MKGKKFQGKGFYPLFCGAIILLIIAFLSGCAEVPLTHRKGLHLVPDSELLTLSFQQYRQMLRESRLSTEQEEVQMVRRVGQKIARAAEGFLRDSGRESQIENYEWEYNLIEDDKVVNAWCMPGGKIAVYTGILPFTKDETGLAVVMGHEVAHAIAGHGNERMSQALLANMGGLALSVALSSKPKQTRELSMIAFGVGATVGVLLPYSRLHESEADRMGLMFMARAGYDPRAAVPFWDRMNEKGGPRPPEFLSTHPAPASRIDNLKAYIPEALPYYQRSHR
ncbi:MAG: M48 family metallopeptidase [Deltaproteobacteria bacterium]|nr:MAG: M48 family metallopeptidase [Deltaproteobacteria bacterium]